MNVRIDLKLVKDISKPVDLLEKKYSIYMYTIIQRSEDSVYSFRCLEPIESANTFELILPT